MQHSHTHREIITGKTIHVFINGDLFFKAKAVVVHPKSTRNFEALLIRLTEILNPRFGAVLHLKTPDGSTEIKSLGELVSGASYVAYGKKFQALDYSDISAKLESFSHGGQALTSPREFKRMIVSGRARKIVRHPILINVYTNGEPLKPAKRVLLQPWVHKTWDNVLEQIASKVSLRSAIRKLIDLSTKTVITFGADLRDQQYYVACGSDKFKDFEYGLSPTMFTPKQQMAKRYPSLPPIEPKERHEAGQKSSQSAPTEKSKEELHPKPPPGKKPSDDLAERTHRKPHKLRTPSPQDSVTEEERYSSNSLNGPPTKSAANHRVSPILEQKTPSSTRTGPKEDSNEAKSESKKSADESRNPTPTPGTPRDDKDISEYNNMVAEQRAPARSFTEEFTSSRPHSSVNNSPTLPNEEEPVKATDPDTRPSTPKDDLFSDPKVHEDVEEKANDAGEDKNDIAAAESSADDNLTEDIKEADAKVEEEDAANNVNTTTEEESIDKHEAETEIADNTNTAEDNSVDNTNAAEDNSADSTNAAEDNSANNTSAAEDKPADNTSRAEDKPADNTSAAEDNSADNTSAAEDNAVDNTNAAEDKPADNTNAAEDNSADNTRDNKQDEPATEDKVDDGKATPAKPEEEADEAAKDGTSKDSTPEPVVEDPGDDNKQPSRQNSSVALTEKDGNNNSDPVTHAAPVETQG